MGREQHQDENEEATWQKSGEPSFPEPQITQRAGAEEYTMYNSEGRWVLRKRPIKGHETQNGVGSPELIQKSMHGGMCTCNSNTPEAETRRCPWALWSASLA